MNDFYILFSYGRFLLNLWRPEAALRRWRLVTWRLVRLLMSPVLVLTSLTSGDIPRPLECGHGHHGHLLLLLGELGVVRD